MENTLTTTIPVTAINDPRPESTAFTNVKLYNHLIDHKRKGGKHSFCSIDCMTRKFENRSFEGSRKMMRRRLATFLRWVREEHDKFIVVPRGDDHNEALAAKIFDPLNADDRDRELVASDLNRALHRKEITEETYKKIFEILYPLLNGTPGTPTNEENPAPASE